MTSRRYQAATAAPLDKVRNSALAGAAIAVVAYLLKQFAGIDLPVEVISALVVLVSFAVAYFTPIAPGEVEMS